MKKLLYIAIPVLIAASFTGCLKDDPNVDFDGLKPIIELPYSGLSYFGSDALNFSTDTITLPIVVNLASVSTLSTDLTVTVDVNPDAITTYNSTLEDPSTGYVAMPTGTYSFPVTTATIPAGKRLDTLYVTFYHYDSLIDPATNYMLPISIKAADNVTISGNFGTHYYHIIGNPLAGTYNWSFYRWNDVSDTTGPPNSSVFEDEPTTVTPFNSSSILLPEGYLNANALGNGGVTLTFSNTGGVITNPVLSIDAVTQKAIDDGGFKVVTQPTMIEYEIVGDASTKYKGTHFRYYFEILNSSGGNRKTINDFVKQ